MDGAREEASDGEQPAGRPPFPQSALAERVAYRHVLTQREEHYQPDTRA